MPIFIRGTHITLGSSSAWVTFVVLAIIGSVVCDLMPGLCRFVCWQYFQSEDWPRHSQRFLRLVSMGALTSNLLMIAAIHRVRTKLTTNAYSVLSQGENETEIAYISAPVRAGTKRVKYLEENVASLDVKLSEAEVEQLSNVISKDEVTPRHPACAANIILHRDIPVKTALRWQAAITWMPLMCLLASLLTISWYLQLRL